MFDTTPALYGPGLQEQWTSNKFYFSYKIDILRDNHILKLGRSNQYITLQIPNDELIKKINKIKTYFYNTLLVWVESP